MMNEQDIKCTPDDIHDHENFDVEGNFWARAPTGSSGDYNDSEKYSSDGDEVTRIDSNGLENLEVHANITTRAITTTNTHDFAHHVSFAEKPGFMNDKQDTEQTRDVENNEKRGVSRFESWTKNSDNNNDSDSTSKHNDKSHDCIGEEGVHTAASTSASTSALASYKDDDNDEKDEEINPITRGKSDPFSQANGADSKLAKMILLRKSPKTPGNVSFRGKQFKKITSVMDSPRKYVELLEHSGGRSLSIISEASEGSQLSLVDLEHKKETEVVLESGLLEPNFLSSAATTFSPRLSQSSLARVPSQTKSPLVQSSMVKRIISTPTRTTPQSSNTRKAPTGSVRSGSGSGHSGSGSTPPDFSGSRTESGSRLVKSLQRVDISTTTPPGQLRRPYPNLNEPKV